MLIFHTGFDFIRTSTSLSDDLRTEFSQLGWNDFPTGPGSDSDELLVFDGGRFNYGKYFRFRSVSTLCNVSRPFPNGHTADEVYMGCAINVSFEAAFYVNPYFGVSNTGNRVIQVVFKDFGVIEVRSLAGLLWTSPAGSYFNSVWHYVEFGVKLSSTSTGWFTLKIDGNEILALINTATGVIGNLTVNALTLGNTEEATTGSTSYDALFDDIYICDETGSSNNTFLGNSRVQALLPNGNSGSPEWSVEPVTNANWESAGNTNMDDSAYVYSNVVDDQDQYTIQSMVNTPVVFGVQVTGLYRQDDATQRSACNVITSNSVEVEGAEFNTPSSYAASLDLFENDPDTLVAWLPTAVNALTVGPKVKS
jgi:hypothetical protein